MSCTGSPVAARTASAYGGMLVHSRTIAATSGWRATRRFAAATVARSASSTSSSARSSRTVARKRESSASPSIGVSARAPTARRCSALSEAASAVTMPTRRPSDQPASISATSSRLDVHTGTATAAASSRWNRARKPQLVVSAATPSASSARAASMKGASRLAIALDDDALRRGAADDAVADRKRERARMADVAGRPREARLEHDDAERRAHSEVAARAAWS